MINLQRGKYYRLVYFDGTEVHFQIFSETQVVTPEGRLLLEELLTKKRWAALIEVPEEYVPELVSIVH
jgi:trehalose-6-phosphatase